MSVRSVLSVCLSFSEKKSSIRGRMGGGIRGEGQGQGERIGTYTHTHHSLGLENSRGLTRAARAVIVVFTTSGRGGGLAISRLTLGLMESKGGQAGGFRAVAFRARRG